MRLQGLPSHTARLVWLAVAVSVCFALALSGAAARADAAPDMLVGIEQNGSMEDPARRAENFETMGLLGAKVARFVLRFDQVARCDPRRTGAANPANPCYDWSVPAAVVANARAKNMQVVFSVVGVPGWYNGGQRYGVVGTTQRGFDGFVGVYADFVQAAAVQFPAVPYWTIWNEPNSSYFFSPQKVNGRLVSPQRYATLYNAAARRLKAANPGALVAPGPTGSSSTTKPGVFIAQFLAALPAGAPVDAYAHNPYLQDSADPETHTRNWRSPSESTLGFPSIGLANLGDLTKLLDRDAATAGDPLWLTEFAYETAPDPAGVEAQRAAAWTAEAMYSAWTNPRVKMFIWYALFDDGDGGAEGFQSGLFQSLGTCGQRWCPKPGAYMYRHPLHVSTERARVGDTVTLWGQGRLDAQKARIWVWEGRQWQAFDNRPDANGSLWVTWKLRGPSWFVVCDVGCGPMRQITVG